MNVVPWLITVLAPLSLLGADTFSTLRLDRNRWKTLAPAAIDAAVGTVPGQEDFPELAEWSCGPNSVTRALVLLDAAPHKTPEQYRDFALRFPRGVGSPQTLKGKTMGQSFALAGMSALLGAYGENRGVARAAYALLGLASVAVGAAPHIISAFNKGAGPLPRWIVDHINGMSHESHVTASLVEADEFAPVLATIKEAIAGGAPVIPLHAYSVLTWHYFVIVGYSDAEQRVLAIDTDSRFEYMSYAKLGQLMDLRSERYTLILSYLAGFLSLVTDSTRLANFSLIKLQR